MLDWIERVCKFGPPHPIAQGTHLMLQVAKGTFQVDMKPQLVTGDLAGLAGTFVIKIVDGEHFYEFSYSLP